MLALISLAVGVLVGGFTAYYEYTRPATYQSTAVMLIDQASDLSTGADVGVVDKLSKLRIKYVGIVRTQVFADPVATAVGLPEPQVRHALRAAIDPNSLLMTVSAITRNRQQSQTIAEEAGKQLVSYVQHEQDVVRVPDASRVTFTVVTPAGTAVRITPDRRRAELVGLFVFLAITIAGLLGADLLRRSRRQS
jgi:capsular polysaccharide biosynthesis protein